MRNLFLVLALPFALPFIGVAQTAALNRPMAVISLPVEQSLYWKCGNEIRIYDTRGTGSPASLSTSASGGKLIPDPEDPAHFFLVPTERRYMLTRGGSSETYRVIKPPSPTITLWVNGREYQTGIPISKRSSVSVEVKPDPEFLRTLPKDAQYGITGISLSTYSSMGTSKLGRFTPEPDTPYRVRIKLGEVYALQKCPPGTRVAVELEGIYRIDFQGRKIPEKCSPLASTLTLVIK